VDQPGAPPGSAGTDVLARVGAEGLTRGCWTRTGQGSGGRRLHPALPGLPSVPGSPLPALHTPCTKRTTHISTSFSRLFTFSFSLFFFFLLQGLGYSECEGGWGRVYHARLAVSLGLSWSLLRATWDATARRSHGRGTPSFARDLPGDPEGERDMNSS